MIFYLHIIVMSTRIQNNHYFIFTYILQYLCLTFFYLDEGPHYIANYKLSYLIQNRMYSVAIFDSITLQELPVCIIVVGSKWSKTVYHFKNDNHVLQRLFLSTRVMQHKIKKEQIKNSIIRNQPQQKTQKNIILNTEYCKKCSLGLLREETILLIKILQVRVIILLTKYFIAMSNSTVL